MMISERVQPRIFTWANAITAIRLLAFLPVTYFLVRDGLPNIPALVVFVAAALTDGLDGYLARRLGEVTELGQLLDPVADKILGLTLFGALVWLGVLPIWLLAVLAAKEFTLLIGGSVLLRFGRQVVAARTLGKVTTVLLFTGFALILAGETSVGFFLTVAAVISSLAAGIDYGMQVFR